MRNEVSIVNRARHLVRTVGGLLLGVAIAGAPALTYAQHGGGGGGGGHSSGGGGHVGGMGGGGFSGGHAVGGAHFSGAPHFVAGPHYFGGAHYVGGPRYGPAHYVTGPHYVAHTGFVGGRPGALPHVGAPTAPATAYWHGGHAWAGGYYHGVYWPHCWYYPGWAWYLPVLPIGYATFWWGGVPYYYWNSLYYTWNPADNGYVVTNPPPAGGDSTQPAPDESGGSYDQAAPSSGGGDAELFLYPRNGQTDQQMQNDRYECHGWAVNQSGFDPTRPDQQGYQQGSAGDPQAYRRAMIACLDARGYSAR